MPVPIVPNPSIAMRSLTENLLLPVCYQASTNRHSAILTFCLDTD